MNVKTKFTPLFSTLTAPGTTLPEVSRKSGKPLAISKPENRYQTIYAVVEQIPPGFVATYGQIARLAGLQGGARQVGYALHALAKGSAVPWHRVVNAQGRISPRSGGGPADLIQRLCLEAEGVEFDEQGRMALPRFQWREGSMKRQ